MTTTSTTESAAGELVARFQYGKGFLIFLLMFGVILLGMAGFVLYLSTLLPASGSGPVTLTTQRGNAIDFSSPTVLIYCTSAFLPSVWAHSVSMRGTRNCVRATTSCMSAASPTSPRARKPIWRSPRSKTSTCSVRVKRDSRGW
jgi:hypothetical protein